MHNSEAFDKEVNLSQTEMINMLREAHTTVFTVCFTRKKDEERVQKKLKKISQKYYEDTENLA